MNAFTLASFAHAPWWIAWREDMVQDKTGKEHITKVPYSTPQRRGKSDDPATWLTHEAATEVAEAIRNGRGCGVGIWLGEHADVWLCGIDLDTCRDPVSGVITPWAVEIIQRFGSYTEVSPSGTGAKIFFHLTRETAVLVAPLMSGSRGRQWKRGGDDHPPAIELYTSHRYFTCTYDTLEDSTAEICAAKFEDLRWLIIEAGPRFKANGSGKGASDAGTGPNDQSRSAAAFRKGAALRRAAATFEEMVDALRADPETAAWVREKGEQYGQRELHRIWDRAAPEIDGPQIQVIPGKLHVMTTQAKITKSLRSTVKLTRFGGPFRLSQEASKMSKTRPPGHPSGRECSDTI